MLYSGGTGAFGSWLELHQLDRLLTQLTRPSLVGDGVSPALRDELRSLGLSVSRTGRKELVERVWGRKRPLLRQLGLDDDDDSTPPPCA
jgi:hypothetical protein